jgi:flavin reductase (DIM6/NTAB) family NADH-FMN oxidoreductase RutF
MLLVCMNRASDTGRAIGASHRFAVNVLHAEQQPLAVQLARKGASKLDGISFADGRTALPVLDDALAVLECTVADVAGAATHVVYLAHVDHVICRSGRPLVYFRGRFARLGEELT